MSSLHDDAKGIGERALAGDHTLMKASSLHVDHIDSVIEFFWTYPLSKVLARISGELRQVHHDGNGTTIALTGWPERADLQEFELGHDTPIEVQFR